MASSGPDDEGLQPDDRRTFERFPQRNEDGIGLLPEAQESCFVGDRPVGVSPLQPEEAMCRDVLGSLDRSMFQSDQRALIVPSAQRVASDLIERECVADPFSISRDRRESTRPEDPAIGDKGMTAALTDDPLSRLELSLEEADPFVPESFAAFTGCTVPTTELSARPTVDTTWPRVVGHRSRLTRRKSRFAGRLGPARFLKWAS